MSVPAVLRATVLCCGLLSFQAIANPLPLNAVTESETLYHQEARTRVLTFMVQIDADGESHQGQVILRQETFMNGAVLDFASAFEQPLPEGLKLPSQERIIEENGTITTNTLYQGDELGQVRMHMYGTFADLERLVTTLAVRHRYGHVSGSEKEYQSQFLLMNKPAYIVNLEIDSNTIGPRVEVMMSNDATIAYQWDSEGLLTTLSVVDDSDTKITYTVVDREEG